MRCLHVKPLFLPKDITLIVSVAQSAQHSSTTLSYSTVSYRTIQLVLVLVLVLCGGGVGAGVGVLVVVAVEPLR